MFEIHTNSDFSHLLYTYAIIQKLNSIIMLYSSHVKEKPPTYYAGCSYVQYVLHVFGRAQKRVIKGWGGHSTSCCDRSAW